MARRKLVGFRQLEKVGFSRVFKKQRGVRTRTLLFYAGAGRAMVDVLSRQCCCGDGLTGRNLRMQPIKWDGKTLELGTPTALGGIVRYPYKVNDTVVRLR